MTRPTTPNGLRQLLRERTVWSTFVKVAALELVDLLATTALDLIVVDLEHSQLDEGQARHIVRHATALGLPAVVRIPTVDHGAVNRLLEAGAVGLQLSGVDDVAQVDALANATRFAPLGCRSVSVGQPAAGYGAIDVACYVSATWGQPLLVGQIESPLSEDSALVDVLGRLDVTFVGVTDLSVALGRPGDTEHSEVTDAVAQIAALAAARHSTFGGWASSRSQAAGLERQGARYLTLSSDLAIVRSTFCANFGSADAGVVSE